MMLPAPHPGRMDLWGGFRGCYPRLISVSPPGCHCIVGIAFGGARKRGNQDYAETKTSDALTVLRFKSRHSRHSASRYASSCGA